MDAVFSHHLYEYKKGLRRLILHTVARSSLPELTGRLECHSVAWKAIPLGSDRANLFFGDEVCVEIIRRIGKDSLVDYTPEEDFILGTMLGYCREKQCRRYLELRERNKRKISRSARETLVG